MAKWSPAYAGPKALVDLCAAIRRARTAAGLSQEAPAVDAGVDRSYMGGLEWGLALPHLHAHQAHSGSAENSAVRFVGICWPLRGLPHTPAW